MNSQVKRIGYVIIIVVTALLILQYKKEYFKILSLMMFPFIVWISIDFFITESKIRDGIWMNYGKTKYHYGRLIVSCVFGIITILMTREDSQEKDMIFKLQPNEFFGLLTIIQGFLSIKSYRLLFQDSSLLVFTEFDAREIQYGIIHNISFEESELVIATRDHNFKVNLKFFSEKDLSDLKIKINELRIPQNEMTE